MATTKELKNTEKPVEKATKKEYTPMSRKKLWTIIISSIVAVVLLTTSIVTIVLLTRKKWDLTPTYTITYNNHKNLKVVSPANNVSIHNESNPTYYSNGTVFIKNNDTETYGVYSYIDNKEIIPTSYEISNITPIELKNGSASTKEYIFQLNNKFGEISKVIKFVNDNGEDIKITHFNSEENENYAYIKQRKMSVTQKRKGIKVKTKSKFYNKEIKITNAEYVKSFIAEDKYNYELWNISSSEGIIYENLYKIEDNERILVQTLNNVTGNAITLDKIDLTINFLKNGDPVFYNSTLVTANSDETILHFKIYNKDLEEICSEQISYNNINSTFVVGNKLIVQSITNGNEEDYDFTEMTDSYTPTIGYYKIKTTSFNLKNGKVKEEKFKYVLTDVNDSFNTETVLLTARKIEDKNLGQSELLIINDKLQTKQISYEIDSITKVNDSRYIVENDQGQYIIDENYDLICYLGQSQNYFVTENAIMLSNIYTGITHVCSLDGIVVKSYNNENIINASDSEYYIVKTETEKEDGTYNELYLESLGIRQKNPIYSQKQDSESYIYKDTEYVAFNYEIINDGITIFTRVRKNNDTFTYEFYNIRGEKLLQLDNFTTPNRVLNYWGYYDESGALLYISTNVGGIGYYLVVDR